MRTLSAALFSLFVLAGALGAPGLKSQATARHATGTSLTSGDGKDGGTTGGDDDDDDDDEEVRVVG